MAQSKTKLNEYFAATNGFEGFRSYFHDIFNPKNYDTIYILKGGPGTGKSSIMRYLASSLNDKCESIDLIYCSSDVKSLDGIVIKEKNKNIAIIDGTAPHMTDPKYPGASEKIVNLGECWNEKALKTQRKNIIQITESKECAYKSAYHYLKICKMIDQRIEEIIEKLFVYDCIEKIKELIPDESSTSFKTEDKFIEAFGNGGFYRVNGMKGKKTYSVVGIYGSEFIFYRYLIDFLQKKKISYLRYPSVLKNGESIGVFITETQTEIINLTGSVPYENNIIDTSRFLNQTELSKEKNRLEFLWREREIMLWNSVSEFKSASNYHFELEKIYTSAMNFNKIDKVKEKLLSQAKRTLLIKD